MTSSLRDDIRGVMTWGELYDFLRANGHAQTARALRLAKDRDGFYIADPYKQVGPVQDA